MPKRFSLLWILLAGGLVTGHLVERPAAVVSQETTLGPAGSPSYALPVLRPHRGLLLRSTAERQPSLAWAVAPGQKDAWGLTLPVTTGPTDGRSVRTGNSARHFPLFPTGPPSDG